MKQTNKKTNKTQHHTGCHRYPCISVYGSTTLDQTHVWSKMYLR